MSDIEIASESQDVTFADEMRNKIREAQTCVVASRAEKRMRIRGHPKFDGGRGKGKGKGAKGNQTAKAKAAPTKAKAKAAPKKTPKMLRLYPNGCPKCRYIAGCTASCYKKLGETI